MKFNTQKLVLTALFAALTCVATMIIRIPTPGTGGYIHPGDALVILSGIILGPLYGFLAAGLGSCLSDFLGGYFSTFPPPSSSKASSPSSQPSPASACSICQKAAQPASSAAA